MTSKRDDDVTRAMLLREASASTRLDRDETFVVGLPDPALDTPQRGWPWAGMSWDEEVEGWAVKDAPDGRRVWVVPFAFTAAIIIGDPDSFEYDDRWCYATESLAASQARAWSAEPGTEPTGWHRHPITGRRRPGGDPAREYVMP